MWFDHEADLVGAQVVGQRLPLRHRQYRPEMAHRHRIAVDLRGSGRSRLGTQMGDDLMPEKIEIDPVVGTAPFFAAKQFTIKLPGAGQIVHWKGQMKRNRIGSGRLRKAFHQILI